MVQLDTVHIGEILVEVPFFEILLTEPKARPRPRVYERGFKSTRLHDFVTISKSTRAHWLDWIKTIYHNSVEKIENCFVLLFHKKTIENVFS